MLCCIASGHSNMVGSISIVSDCVAIQHYGNSAPDHFLYLSKHDQELISVNLKLFKHNTYLAQYPF